MWYSMNKKKISFVLNVFIILFELQAIVYNAIVNKWLALEFYTELSNLFALVTSTLYVFYLIKGKKMPSLVSLLKYSSTVCLGITFIVVLFILLPMSYYDVKAMFFDGILLYHHLLCPLLSIISFLFFDDLKVFDQIDMLFSLSFTCVYAVVLIVLNLLYIIEGPYPFLMIRSQSVLASTIWMIIIFSFSFTVSYLFKYFYNRRVKL